jgi:hypothetical protein
VSARQQSIQCTLAPPTNQILSFAGKSPALPGVAYFSASYAEKLIVLYKNACHSQKKQKFYKKIRIKKISVAKTKKNPIAQLFFFLYITAKQRCFVKDGAVSFFTKHLFFAFKGLLWQTKLCTNRRLNMMRAESERW